MSLKRICKSPMKVKYRVSYENIKEKEAFMLKRQGTRAFLSLWWHTGDRGLLSNILSLEVFPLCI